LNTCPSSPPTRHSRAGALCTSVHNHLCGHVFAVNSG